MIQTIKGVLRWDFLFLRVSIESTPANMPYMGKPRYLLNQCA